MNEYKKLLNTTDHEDYELIKVPPTSRTIETLRHSDYDNVSAIQDIVDNSIDAGATKVAINVHGDNNDIKCIKIIDNGCGMDKDTLLKALTIGSKTNKNIEKHLGFYGFGLKTAGSSIGRKIIVACSKNNMRWQGVYDLDEIAKREEIFVKIKSIPHKHSKTEVSIENIDRLEWSRASTLIKKIKEGCSQVYRKFLKKKELEIYVNKEKISYHDPIFGYPHEILLQETVEFSCGKMDITIVEIGEITTEMLKNENSLFLMNGQGFYLIRNNREVESGTTLKIFNRHHNFGKFRAELSFNGNFDKLLGLNFKKKGARLTNEAYLRLKNIAMPYITECSKRAQKRAAEKRLNSNEIDYSELIKIISKKANTLRIFRKPNTRTKVFQGEEGNEPKTKEKRNPPKNPTPEHKGGTKNPGETRTNKTSNKKGNLKQFVNYSEITLGSMGPLFSPSLGANNVIDIAWNVDHPFYQDVIEKIRDDKKIFYPLQYLIYSLAEAEVFYAYGEDESDVEPKKFMEGFRYNSGFNLSSLLR